MATIAVVPDGKSKIIFGSLVNGHGMSTGVQWRNATGKLASKGTNIFTWLKVNDSAAWSALEQALYRSGQTLNQTFTIQISQDMSFTFGYSVWNQSNRYIMDIRLLSGNTPSIYAEDLSLVYSSGSKTTQWIDNLRDSLLAYGMYLVVDPYSVDSAANIAIVAPYDPSISDYRYQKYDNLCFYGGSVAGFMSNLKLLFKNPASGGPDSEEDGGWGDFNDGSDNISLPGLPGLSALSSGFVNMYNPTAAEITTMAQILWATDPGTAIKNWLQAPMDSIVSLGIMPLAPDISPTKVHVVVGNFVIATNDLPPVYMDSYPLINQYKIFDCGSLNMNEYWGNALDYSPYSKAEIFLPYIGVKEIDINDVMAATLHLQYIVDFLTGTCTAQLQCVKAQHMDFSAPLYHWQGNMMSQIPTNGADFGQFITAITSTLVSAGLTVATGGSGAVIAAGVAGGALNMANAHPRIEKGGTIAMIAGAMDNQTPYIILTRPIQSKPANFNGFKGWPSNITAEIGSLTGYTEIEYIHVEIDSATDEEKSEIERLLKEGVII